MKLLGVVVTSRHESNRSRCNSVCLRKVMDAKKALEQRVGQLEHQLEVGEALAEQLQHENMQLRLSKPAASLPLAGAAAGVNELEATRHALAKAEEELSRYKARTAVILRQRRPGVAGAALQGEAGGEGDVLGVGMPPGMSEEAEVDGRGHKAELARLRGEVEAAEARAAELQRVWRGGAVGVALGVAMGVAIGVKIG